MKKYLYSSAIIIIIFVFFADINNTLQRNALPSILLANVEALASGESGGQPMDCYSNIEMINDGRQVETVTYCGDCKPIQCTNYWSSNRCMR